MLARVIARTPRGHAMLSPVPIDPCAVYDDGAVVLALEISSAALARARREGRLRYSRRGKRTFYLGQWLIDWLTADGVPAGGKGVPDAG
jgi:hypothetical protein